jgi:hypothetical protein
MTPITDDPKVDDLLARVDRAAMENWNGAFFAEIAVVIALLRAELAEAGRRLAEKELALMDAAKERVQATAEAEARVAEMYAALATAKEFIGHLPPDIAGAEAWWAATKALALVDRARAALAPSPATPAPEGDDNA